MTKKQQSYQDLKQALDAILLKLQDENTDIDEAVTLHAEGQKILKELDAYLQRIADQSAA